MVKRKTEFLWGIQETVTRHKLHEVCARHDGYGGRFWVALRPKSPEYPIGIPPL